MADIQRSMLMLILINYHIGQSPHAVLPTLTRYQSVINFALKASLIPKDNDGAPAQLFSAKEVDIGPPNGI